jgi:predicted transcriptional regulator
VRPKQVVRDTVRDFINRLFNGSPMALLEHLIRDQGLEKAELDQLRQLLSEVEAEPDSTSAS